MKRRSFVSGTAALATAALVRPAFAATIKPYSWDLNPPTDTRENFIAWGMAPRRGSEIPRPALGPLPGAGRATRTSGTTATMRAFLLTPREEFVAVNPAIHKRAYEHAFLDIGYGVTISGPHLQSAA